MSLEIREIEIEKIIPAPYNPRVDLTSNNKEYKYIENSINKFGYVEPIIWNEDTGHIVGGHQRFKILKAQGLKTIQVVVVHFDSQTEKACNLALNRAVGQWDDDKLDLLLCETIMKMILMCTVVEFVSAVLDTPFVYIAKYKLKEKVIG